MWQPQSISAIMERMPSEADLRKHPRMPVAVALRVRTTLGVVETVTVNVSRGGLSAVIVPPPPVASELHISVDLPDGTNVGGIGRCRSRLPSGVCGLELAWTGEALARWNRFIDEEESTGGLWRMIGRASRTPPDALAPRGLHETVASEELQFHTVGENGEAYRIAFAKHVSDPWEVCDLAQTQSGFHDNTRRLVSRVLREPLTLKLNDRSAPVSVRVASLLLGGYAWVQGSDTVPATLIALTGAELILVARGGQSVFPHFTLAELEHIACDAFRSDLRRPMFPRSDADKAGSRAASLPQPGSGEGAPVSPEDGRAQPKSGFAAVRRAQAESHDTQIRRFGDKDIFFFPSVWARVKEGGHELMGPTMHDGMHISVLALVGPETPRVLQIDESSQVSLLRR